MQPYLFCLLHSPIPDSLAVLVISCSNSCTTALMLYRVHIQQWVVNYVKHLANIFIFNSVIMVLGSSIFQRILSNISLQHVATNCISLLSKGTLRDSKGQWGTVRDSEGQWGTVRDSEGQWGTVRDSKKATMQFYRWRWFKYVKNTREKYVSNCVDRVNRWVNEERGREIGRASCRERV